MGFNQLTSLEGLSPLVNLSSLDLSGNQLTSLAELSPLVNLSSLNLDFNQLTSLAELSPLVNLSALDLSFNKLSRLPETLLALPKLEYLNLKDNPVGESWTEKGFASESGDVHLLKVRNYIRGKKDGHEKLIQSSWADGSFF